MRELIDAAAVAAARLVLERGISPPEAVRMAARAAVQIAEGGGLGVGQVPDVVAAAVDAPPVKAVREAVTPWLWILSLVSFGMAVTNYERISRMFRDWRRKKRK